MHARDLAQRFNIFIDEAVEKFTKHLEEIHIPYTAQELQIALYSAFSASAAVEGVCLGLPEQVYTDNAKKAFLSTVTSVQMHTITHNARNQS